MARISGGGVSERPKERASKAREGSPFRGFKSHRHRHDVHDITDSRTRTGRLLLRLPPSAVPAPGQDLLAVRRTDAAELLVPFVRAFVPEVDVAGGFVVVDLPDGLAELGES